MMPSDLVIDANDLPTLIAAFDTAIKQTLSEESLWFTINLYFQIAAVILGVISTLFMAIQNDKNSYWAKPIGIIATTLSAGIITAYSTFHITQNISTIMDIEKRLISNRNELSEYIISNPDKKSDFETEKKYGNILNEEGSKRRALWGGLGKGDTTTK